ncbi:MAG: T9SS type A sorting domain-containing protein [Bacteroidia bacterium]|nr:T9SS type A sorting domain-containing protein [Bacteroidia bacterium]
MKNITFFLFLVLPFAAAAQLPLVNGWTQFSAGADTRILYVSDTDGNDATAQTYTAGAPEVGADPFVPAGAVQPYKTINAARAQLRNGFPDWILLKKGDVFTDQHFGTLNISGKSATEPMLIGSYGTAGVRPRVHTGAAHLVAFSGAASYIAISGLYAEPHTRTGADEPSAVYILNAPFRSFLVEDCYFNRFSMQIVVQDYSGSPAYTHIGFTARRNIIADGYKTGGGGGGVYMHRVDSILFEENLIDHNGWNAGLPGAEASGFSHNTYFQSSCAHLVFRNNIVSRASAVGIGARCGGRIENNLLLANPRNIFIGSFDPGQINWPAEGVAGEVWNNVVLGARAEAAFDAGNGITVDRVRNVDVYRNVVAHFTDTSTYNTAIGLDHIDNVNLRKNIIYRWGNNRISGFDMAGGIQFGGNRAGTNRIDSNDIQLLNPQGYCVQTNGSFADLAFSANRYHNVTAAGDWFGAGDYAAWLSASGETGSVQEQVSYTDPERNIASYLATTGQSGSLPEFITLRRQMSRDHWDDRYTAPVVNTYIREGFDMETEQPPVSEAPTEALSALVLFPNPSSDHTLNIVLPQAGAYNIYDMGGRTLRSGQLSAGTHTLVLEGFAPGMYMIRAGKQQARFMLR